MTRPRRGIGLRSVRARLLLWNTGIVTLVLATMGGLISYTVRAKLMASVERDLRDHAARVQPPPPPRNPDDPDTDPGQPDQPPQPAIPREPDGTLSIRVPRVFNLDGVGRPPFQDKAPWDADAFAASLKGQEVMKTILVDGEPARLYSRPQWPRHGPPPRPGRPPAYADDTPRPGDQPLGVIQTVYPLAEINRSIDEMNATLLTLIPVGLLFAACGGAWLTDRALRPVRQISQTAASIGAADLRQRLPLSGGDEFAELAGTINGMLERLQAAFGRMETLVQEQRRFTADASHELKTPLTVIKANSSLTLATEPDRASYHEAILEIDHAADSMNHLVQDLLLLARADEAQAGRNRKRICVADLLAEVADPFRRPGAAAIRIAPVDPNLQVEVNQDEIERTLANLVKNALQYTPPDGAVTLSCAVDRGSVRITITDTGIGIAPEHLPHLCERFYRVDASRARADGGSGLGLAICKSLTEANGGRLEIASKPGCGTTVTLTLPASAKLVSYN
ncbi:MAG TPA: ATP-binding protein [Chthonomonadaceae bacterium]|nr:ATP-binding protein [Chthonomonadaceae bacterium]